MRLHELLAESSTATPSFELPAGLTSSNYRLGPLSDVANWQAKIMTGNSAREGQELGQWDGVGYVMVSTKDNTIVPIARADEHNAGFDLLHDLAAGRKRKVKIKIDPRDYVAINRGQNFVYSESDITRLTPVAKKWLDWGGPDCIVRGTYDADGLYGHMSDLIKHGLKMMPQHGRLNVMGDRLIKALRALSALVEKREMADRSGRTTTAMDRSIFRAANVMIKIAIPILDHLWVSKPNPKTAQSDLATLEQNGDIEGLQQFVYGFTGIKNAIHQKVRAAIDDPRGMKTRETIAVFGDLDMANGMLADL